MDGRIRMGEERMIRIWQFLIRNCPQNGEEKSSFFKEKEKEKSRKKIFSFVFTYPNLY
jgi:hypothetical protein